MNCDFEYFEGKKLCQCNKPAIKKLVKAKRNHLKVLKKYVCKEHAEYAEGNFKPTIKIYNEEGENEK